MLRLYEENRCVLRFSYIQGQGVKWIERNTKATLALNILKDCLPSYIMGVVGIPKDVDEIPQFTGRINEYIEKFCIDNFPYLYSWVIDFTDLKVKSLEGEDFSIERNESVNKIERYIVLY